MVSLLNKHRCVLITGGCGAIGSVLLNYLRPKYPKTRFINLDALTYCGKREHILPPHDNYVFYEGNICDSDFVLHILQSEKPTLLIHLAAETHVDQSFGNSLLFTQTNVYGTHTLLECVRQYKNLQLFLHMSTDEVYGSVKDGQTCTEDAMFSPSNPYSASKAAAEMICHAYKHSFNIPIIITRCNNVISQFQHHEKLIPCAIKAILEGQQIPVHGDGSAKRVYIDAIDVASAIEVIITHGLIGQIYNIGTNQEYDVLSVIRNVLLLIRPNDSLHDWVRYVPDRAFQDYRYSIDTRALMNLGWRPNVTFIDSLKNIVDYKTKQMKKDLYWV